MKNYLNYMITIVFVLNYYGKTKAQSVKEFNFKPLESKFDTNRDLVGISIKIDTNQRMGPGGIGFMLIVKNRSSETFSIKNIADQLQVMLSNSLGLNVAIKNEPLVDLLINRHQKKWKFRSEAMTVEKVYIKDNKITSKINNLEQQEYIGIPPHGNCTLNLSIKNIRPVKNREDYNKILPKVDLKPGTYRLELSLFVTIKSKQDLSGRPIAIYRSPVITIHYEK